MTRVLRVRVIKYSRLGLHASSVNHSAPRCVCWSSAACHSGTWIAGTPKLLPVDSHGWRRNGPARMPEGFVGKVRGSSRARGVRIPNVSACFRPRIVNRRRLPRTWMRSRFRADTDWAMFGYACFSTWQSLLVVIQVVARLVLLASSPVLASVG